MLHQVLPKLESEASTQDYGRYAIGPMTRGYGVTVGIALRRVLLSSLPGAAVTSVRVSGVPHEFMVIPGAEEDMTLLLLRLKQLRLISHSEDPVHLRVAARGKSVVTAGDIECPPDVEIVNPELQLLTLDTLDSDIEIELVVEQGYGYSPSEERKDLPIGEIPVDAIFSPVTKVSHKVEQARIEQMTNYDLLKLEIWTDGTIRPADALSEAAQVLVQHLDPIAEFGEGEIVEPLPEVTEEEAESAALYDVPIEEIELSVRPFNCLKRAGLTSVGEVLERLEQGREEMLAIRNFGEKSMEQLMEKMVEKGFIPQGFELQ